MSNRMLITKPGKDISSQILDDFYLHTDYPVLKIAAFGTFSFNAGIGSINITHNLGYYPYAIVFCQAVTDDGAGNAVVTSQYYQLPYVIVGATVEWDGKANITTTQIQITVTDTNVVRGAAVHGFYYIFEDRMDTL